MFGDEIAFIEIFCYIPCCDVEEKLRQRSAIGCPYNIFADIFSHNLVGRNPDKHWCCHSTSSLDASTIDF